MRISLFLAGLAAVGCGGSGLDPDQLRSAAGGNLRYEATTLDGAPLIVGRLELEIRSDSTIVGRWFTRWAPGADTTVQVGDHIGNGTLAGSQTESGIHIDLNPGYADNNVFLELIPTDRGFTGGWCWTSIAGPQTCGRFTAFRE